MPASFFDLAANETQLEPVTQKERVTTLLSLGYDGIATVHQAGPKLATTDKCSMKPLTEEELSTAVPTAGIRQPTPQISSKPHQFTRLNIPIDDTNTAQESCSNASIVNSYDIVAVQPQSERSFTFACSSLDVDIISIDLSKRLAYRFKTESIKKALQRGIHFEVSYALALRDQGSKRQFFTNVQALARETRGKGIVLTSKARSVMDIRGPYDAINFMTFLGFTENQARNCITENAMAVVKHAEKRKAYRGTLQVKYDTSV